MFLRILGGYLDNYAYAAVPILVSAVFIGFLWHLLNWITPFNDEEELFDKNNYAYAMQRIALVFAQGIGMLHTLQYSVERDGWAAVSWMGLEGVWVLLALLFARPIVDKVVLARVNNLKAVQAGSKAIGIVEAGFYIAIGFILQASLDGSAPSTAIGLSSTVVFSALGLIVLVVVFFLHELLTSYDMRGNIREGNVTTAIEAAAVLVSVAVVVSAGVAGDFITWRESFAAFSATVLVAVVTLYLARWVIDKMVLRGCTVASVQERNQTVAALVLGCMMVIMAFIVELAIKAHL